jgi:endonuclease-3
MVAPVSPVERARVRAVYERLEAVYGPLRPSPGDEPLGELIGTILSQSTTDINSGRAYQRLRAMYPRWEEVLDASEDEIYEAIKPAGLGRMKAPRIKQTLREVLRRRGELRLDFLAEMPLDEAKRWLVSLDGVGPKTAACVLLFSLGRPALPVDTHVHRVSRRLGLIGPRVSAERAHDQLEAALEPEQVYTFHVGMIRHGRRVCHAQRPACANCPLRDLCDFYAALGGQEEEE